MEKYNNILQLNCDEQFAESAIVIPNKIKLSLYKKSLNSNIPTGILEEVYRRGYSIWNEDFKGSREQFAFDRVNSFIADGFAAQIDEDLKSNPCWKGYKLPEKKKLKKKGNRFVPNCVPVKEESLKPTKTPEELAKKYDMTISQIKKIIKTGAKVEKEHTKNQDIAMKIASAHIDEKPDYYKKLKSAGLEEQTLNEINYAKGSLTPYELKQYTKRKNKQYKKATNIKRRSPRMSHKVSSKGIIKPFMQKIHKILTGTFKENAEQQSKNPDVASSRFDATKSLVKIYKQDTPGEPGKPHHKIKKTIKKIVKETYVAGFEGKKIKIPNQKIRMASGKIESHPPGKSGSSGGGDE